MIWYSAHEFVRDEEETCPCCGGGVDILIEYYGRDCELCGTWGQVEGWKARDYKEWEKARNTAQERVKEGTATVFDGLLAHSYYGQGPRDLPNWPRS